MKKWYIFLTEYFQIWIASEYVPCLCGSQDTLNSENTPWKSDKSYFQEQGWANFQIPPMTPNMMAHAWNPPDRMAHACNPPDRMAHAWNPPDRIAHACNPLDMLTYACNPPDMMAHACNPQMRVASLKGFRRVHDEPRLHQRVPGQPELQWDTRERGGTEREGRREGRRKGERENSPMGITGSSSRDISPGFIFFNSWTHLHLLLIYGN